MFLDVNAPFGDGKLYSVFSLCMPLRLAVGKIEGWQLPACLAQSPQYIPEGAAIAGFDGIDQHVVVVVVVVTRRCRWRDKEETLVYSDKPRQVFGGIYAHTRRQIEYRIKEVIVIIDGAAKVGILIQQSFPEHQRRQLRFGGDANSQRSAHPVW